MRYEMDIIDKLGVAIGLLGLVASIASGLWLLAGLIVPGLVTMKLQFSVLAVCLVFTLAVVYLGRRYFKSNLAFNVFLVAVFATNGFAYGMTAVTQTATHSSPTLLTL